MKQRYFTIILLLLVAVVQTAAQALTDRYNRQNPVVMVWSSSTIMENPQASTSIS